MASDLLAPAQIAEIAERANEQIREGGSEAGEEFAGYIISLLSHAAAQAARIEELEKALKWYATTNAPEVAIAALKGTP